MKKLLLYIIIISCVPASWAEDANILDDWGKWDEIVEQPQLEAEQLPKEVMSDQVLPDAQPDGLGLPSDKDFLSEEAREEGSPDKPFNRFGVGLRGNDEQQLNHLDGSSLMDYGTDQNDPVVQEEGIFDGESYSDDENLGEEIIFFLDEDVSGQDIPDDLLSDQELYQFDESGEFNDFEEFNDLNEFNQFDELDEFERFETFDEPDAISSPVE